MAKGDIVSLSSVMPESSSTATMEDPTTQKRVVPIESVMDPIQTKIMDAAKRNNVNPSLALAVAHTESRYNPRAVSPAGAMGVFQLMPGTAKEMGVQDPWNEDQNIEGGVRYLRKMLEASGGDIDRALESYNFGIGNVTNGVPLPKETIEYKKRVREAMGLPVDPPRQISTEEAPNPEALNPGVQSWAKELGLGSAYTDQAGRGMAQVPQDLRGAAAAPVRMVQEATQGLSQLPPFNVMNDAAQATLDATNPSTPAGPVERAFTQGVTNAATQGNAVQRTVVGGLMDVGSTALGNVATVMGDRERADIIGRDREILAGASAETDKANLGPVGQVLRPAAQSALSNVAQVVGTGVVGGFPAIIGNFMVSSYDSALRQGADSGLQGEELYNFARRQSFVEGGVTSLFQAAGLGGLEKIPLKKVSADLVKEAKTTLAPALKNALKAYGLEELPEETITWALQTADAQMSGVGGELTTEDYLKQWGQVALETGLSMGAAHAPAIAAGAKRSVTQDFGDATQQAFNEVRPEDVQRMSGDLSRNTATVAGVSPVPASEQPIATPQAEPQPEPVAMPVEPQVDVEQPEQPAQPEQGKKVKLVYADMPTEQLQAMLEQGGMTKPVRTAMERELAKRAEVQPEAIQPEPESGTKPDPIPIRMFTGEPQPGQQMLRRPQPQPEQAVVEESSATEQQPEPSGTPGQLPAPGVLPEPRGVTYKGLPVSLDVASDKSGVKGKDKPTMGVRSKEYVARLGDGTPVDRFTIFQNEYGGEWSAYKGDTLSQSIHEMRDAAARSESQPPSKTPGLLETIGKQMADIDAGTAQAKPDKAFDRLVSDKVTDKPNKVSDKLNDISTADQITVGTKFGNEIVGEWEVTHQRPDGSFWVKVPNAPTKYGETEPDPNYREAYTSKELEKLREQVPERTRQIIEYKGKETKRKEAAAESQRKLDEERAKLTSYTSSLGVPPLAKGRLESALTKIIGGYKSSETGKTYQGPRHKVIEGMVADGFVAESEEVPALKEVSRSRYNQMDNSEQQEYEKRRKAAGTKTDYLLKSPGGSYFTVTKAEHDYAKWLASANTSDTQPAPSIEQQPQPAPQKQPWEMKKSEWVSDNIKYSGAEPVPMKWNNSVPEPTPKYLPTPDNPTVAGFHIPSFSASSQKKIMLPDGTIWEYKGIGAYKSDNESRDNGWEEVTSDVHNIYDHKRSVESALRDGQPVPPAVLADYPDLAAKYGDQAQPAPRMLPGAQELANPNWNKPLNLPDAPELAPDTKAIQDAKAKQLAKGYTVEEEDGYVRVRSKGVPIAAGVLNKKTGKVEDIAFNNEKDRKSNPRRVAVARAFEQFENTKADEAKKKLDATPAVGTLPVGASFTDPVTGMTGEVLSQPAPFDNVRDTKTTIGTLEEGYRVIPAKEEAATAEAPAQDAKAAKKAKPSAPDFTALPQKSQDVFNEAWESGDVAKLQEMVEPRNKAWRAEFESRSGVKLPKTLAGTRKAVKEHVSREAYKAEERQRREEVLARREEGAAIREKERAKAIAEAPVFRSVNGWEIVKDGVEYISRDPVTKEEVYANTKFSRVREVAQESAPVVQQPPKGKPKSFAGKEAEPSWRDIDKSKASPMVRQFIEAKEQAGDALVLFRMGDFYESFFEDAQTASDVMGLPLSRRGETLMAGFPVRKLDDYVKFATDNGIKVAVVDQVTDPKESAGITKREVTQTFQPKVEGVLEVDQEAESVVETQPDTVEITPAGKVREAIPHPRANENTTPKQQKEYLLDELDKAEAVLPSERELPKEQKQALDRLKRAMDEFSKLKQRKGENNYSFENRIRDARIEVFSAEKEGKAILPYITIKVPGDGIFSIIATKEKVATFKKMAASFPATKISTEPPKLDSSEVSKAPRLTRPKKTDEVVKQLSVFVSDDKFRANLNFVSLQGDRAVATDGRRAVVVEGKFPGTHEAPKQVLGSKHKDLDPGNFPNIDAIIPKKGRETIGTFKTEDWWHALQQSMSLGTQGGKFESVMILQNPDGSIGFYRDVPEAGINAHNVQEGSKVIQSYNGNFLIETIEHLRKNGHDELVYEAAAFNNQYGRNNGVGVFKSPDDSVIHMVMPIRDLPDGKEYVYKGGRPRQAMISDPFEDLRTILDAAKTFSKDAYERAKPHLQVIYESAKNATDFIAKVVRDIGEHARAYAKRFAIEYRRAGNKGMALNPFADGEKRKPEVNQTNYPPSGSKEVTEGENARLPQSAMVRMIKDLLGTYPDVVTRFPRKPDRLGVFMHGQGDATIRLRADLAIGERVAEDYSKTPFTEEQQADFLDAVAEEMGTSPDDIVVKTDTVRSNNRTNYVMYAYLRDEDYAARTIAHELGHAIDYFPDETLNRGNVLGRIAKLQRFLKTSMAPSPESLEEPFTKEERARWRKEAAIDASRDYGPFEKGDDRKGYYTSAYYRYRLIEEAENRGLLLENTIKSKLMNAWDVQYPGVRDELKRLTHWWNPFDPNIDQKYTDYRYSSKELYAEAMSVLLNNPKAFESKAPEFARGFFAYMERNPEVKKLYDEIQAELHAGDYGKSVLDRVEEMQRLGDVKRKAKHKRENPPLWKQVQDFWRDMKITLIDQQAAVYRTGSAALDPYLWLREVKHLSSTQHQFHRDIHKMVLNPLKEVGLDEKQLGMYMFFRRTSTERKHFFNPLGITESEAKNGMKDMEEKYGAEAMAALRKAADEYYDLRKEYIFPALRDSRLFSADLLKLIEDNENYATFNVIEYIEEFYSTKSNADNSRIFHQVGTFEGVENVFVATMLKDSALIRQAVKNKAKMTVIDVGKELGEVEDAPMSRRAGGQIVYKEPTDPSKQLMKYSLDGQLKAVIIDRVIAQNYETNLVEMNNFTKIVQNMWVSGWFRKSLTTWNPGFGPVAFMKDVATSYKNTPGINPLPVINSLRRAWQDAYIDVVKGKSTMLAKYAYKNNMLIPNLAYDAANAADYETEVERQAHIHGLAGEKNINKNVVLRVLTKAKDGVENWNLFFERWSKLANAYRMVNEGYIEREGVMKASERVRTMAGTPDALAGGRWRRPMNGLFLFSNINIQGLRSTYRAAKEQKLAYMFKVAAVDIAPKLLMRGLQLGMAGYPLGLTDEEDWLKKFYNDVPDSDLMNYTIIPLGRTKDGTPVYIPLPSDHTGMFFGGLAWAITRPLLDERINLDEIGKVVTNQSPVKPDSLTPLPAMMLDLMLLAMGVSPYDTYRGTPAIDRGAMDAGVVAPAMRGEVPEAVKQVAEYEARKYFSTAINFSSDETKDDMINEIGRLPVIGPIMRRYVRASDKGIEQRMRREKSTLMADEAARSERLGSVLRDAVESAGKDANRIDVWRKVSPVLREEKLLTPTYDIKDARRRFNDIWTMTYDTPEDKLKASTPRAIVRQMQTDD